MRRKVIKHGLSTFIVSLPINWVKEFNIQKGSDLEVTEEGNKVIITTLDEIKPLEIKADITGLDRTSIMYVIRGFYRLGYDDVELVFNNPMTIYQRRNEEVNVLSVIHTEVNRLIGYEIIQQRENSCHIKDLQGAHEKDFDPILRRIFFLLDDTAKDFLEGVKSNNLNLLRTIEEKHDTITKFVSFCLRILNKRGHMVPRKTAYYYHIIALLDRIMDSIKYASRNSISYKKKLDPNVVGIIKTVVQDLNNYHVLFYNYDNAKIVEINSHRYEAENILKGLPDSINTKEVLIASEMFDILELLLDLVEARTALEY